jgi:pimeloyl-ACP methyl ester carboxylesterase
MTDPYQPRRIAASRFATLRGLRCHLLEWGEAALATPERPTLVMLHGWMDVAASFQFVVDAFGRERHVLAPDWRGFGLSERPPADSYWFPDYLGDLDALLDTLPGGPIDLLGHSMGGNVAMLYAGIRPARVRRLVNLEGFGLPESQPDQAAGRYAAWLDELKQPMALRRYASLDAVATRLRQNNPRLAPERAAWLASHWSRRDDDGSWSLLGDPAHKRRNPVPYQKAETLAIWERIEAPMMWAEGERTEVGKLWGDRYPRSEFEARLAVVRRIERHVLAEAGHMLHHDQPEPLAARIEAFLEAG